MERVGLRLQLRKQQAEAGDIVLLYGDESEALTHPYLARAWAKSGADLRVPAPGQAKKVAMLGSLDHVTRQLIVHTSPTKRSSDFIAHLEQLDRLFGPQPGRQAKPVVLVEDNGPIHTSKRSLAALAARAHWLTVEWLPKYAPELNEIEPVWRDLKAHHLAHQTFTDVNALDLSRDSLFDQRTDISLSVQGDNRGVNGPVEVVGVGEGLVGEMVGFEIAPDGFDVVEFGRVLGQPFDGEPMGAGGKRGDAGLAHVDRAVVEHDDDRPDRQAWPRAIKAVEPPQQRNEIGAALGFAGVHDEPASGVVERPDHCHLLGLAGRRHTQIGATLSPGSGQVRMRQRLALVGE